MKTATLCMGECGNVGYTTKKASLTSGLMITPRTTTPDEAFIVPHTEMPKGLQGLKPISPTARQNMTDGKICPLS